jgi:hypothetical protein
MFTAVGAHFVFRWHRRSLLRSGLGHEALRKQVAAGHGDRFQIGEQRTPRHARRTEDFVRGLLRSGPDLFTEGRLPLFHLGLSLDVVRPLDGLSVLTRLSFFQTLAYPRLLPDLPRRC